MHLQIDTYTKNPSDGEYDLIHRSYCQVIQEQEVQFLISLSR